MNCSMTIFPSSFNQEALITLYASLPVSQFRKLTRNLASVFGSIYTCEQAFSCMKQNNSKFSSSITYVHLHDSDVNWHFKNGDKC
jgi:hypothetical protein